MTGTSVTRPGSLAIALLVWVFPSFTLAASPPEQVPAARGVWQRITASLDAIEGELPRVVEAAERAAEATVERGASFAVGGDEGLAIELRRAPGAWAAPPVGYGEPDAVRIEAERDRVTLAGVAFDTSDPVHRLALLWTWQVEWFAACTRRGETPVIRRSPLIDTRLARHRRYGEQRFHHDRWLEPIEPGALGSAYLDGVRGVLRDVGTASWGDLTATARRATRTLNAGGRVFVRFGGRTLAHQFEAAAEAFDARWPWTLLDHDGSDAARPSPGPGDLLLAVGDAEPPDADAWGEPDMLLQAGRGIAWVVNGHGVDRRRMPARDVLVDLWCPYGDGVVRVEHYDARVGPAGGVVATAVWAALSAEVASRHE